MACWSLTGDCVTFVPAAFAVHVVTLGLGSCKLVTGSVFLVPLLLRLSRFDYLFQSLWLHWVFVAVWACSTCGEWGLPSSWGLLASPVCRVRAPAHVGFSSRGAWAWWLLSLWDCPRPGIEPTSPYWQVNS